ncbi:hypothetical protein PCANC_08002 [Puccinia coronata f. sp. avenae]|uniref:SET domain-containing protein n=1 Tax=Puccinia coronata f. sp. avenae TaxID=200324 RepID=A0A2N5UH09_9BASI|nr:hypothetical protein PCANC_08002 [Puccinia coronata f. sp. avenae]PLW20806.1 hypothetical protein PCASD_13594 [Puccinia coronata f. sp. avenae]PLW36977.1 hypothetical protein PCASD_06653 [Puccinia coronata f. sp. avenae]
MQTRDLLANIRVGLKEDRLDPIANAPPWLQILSTLSPESSRASEPPSTPSNSESPRHNVVTVFEHHIRPPPYTWCGLLNRDAYPKRVDIRSDELRELTTVRVVPYIETFDKKNRSPAEQLKALEQTLLEGQKLHEGQYEICLTGRICPDVLRHNFYELVKALNLQTNESLLRILPSLLPRQKIPTDEELLQSLASEMTRADSAEECSMLFDLYSRAWACLKESGRLKESPVPVRVPSPNFTIAEIIDSFRLTLPAHKRIFKNSTISSQRQLCKICHQFYCEGHFDPQVPKGSRHPPPTSSPVPEKCLDVPPVDTYGYIPCSHSGECSENHCDCYQLNTHCDRFCRCSESCTRRYPGCSCIMFCDEDCECAKLNRECDPLICKCPACHTIPQSKAGTTSSSPNGCSNFLIATRKKRTFVAPSKIAGFGLFAGETVSSGDLLGEYTGVFLRSDEIEMQIATSVATSSYLFDLNKVDTIDSTKFGNRARFINEPAAGKQPNAHPSVWYVAGSQVIRIFARKTIRIGEEITINYGDKYDDARDWS